MVVLSVFSGKGERREKESKEVSQPERKVTRRKENRRGHLLYKALVSSFIKQINHSITVEQERTHLDDTVWPVDDRPT